MHSTATLQVLHSDVEGGQVAVYSDGAALTWARAISTQIPVSPTPPAVITT